MKVIILGKNGKLAQTFQRKFPDVVAVGRQKTENVTGEHLYPVQSLIEAHSPDVIINCAAYTDVDGAETHRDLAYAINATGVKNLAEICHRNQVKLVHFSTDYVFDGNQQTPYTERAQPKPINYYGHTKLTGEALALYQNPEILIIRFSSPFGREFHNNFPSKVINWLKTNTEISAVQNQWFLPTWADDLVDATFKLLEKRITGRIHFCNSGEPISPYEYASYIAELMGSQTKVIGLPALSETRPAQRPVRAILSTKLYESLVTQPRSWKDALKQYLAAQ